MLFVYLDEFGHIGPFVARRDKKYNDSPVFGLAGIILPDQIVRSFSTYILQRKQETFHYDLAEGKKMAAKWEKKGASFIRPGAMQKYPSLPSLVARTLRHLKAQGGGTFYYGREKRVGFTDGNSTGLYTTCLSHALRHLDAIAATRNEKFIVILDEHVARKELLECAAKTMFGQQPCRNLASPPFEVESYLDQNMQAADWVATLVGRIMTHQVSPTEYSDFEYFCSKFLGTLNDVSLGSVFERRRPKPTEQRILNRRGPFSELPRLLAAAEKK